MCSRLKLLWNIDEKTIEDLLRALSRMVRLYIFLSLLTILSMYTSIVDDNLFYTIYNCGILVLYALYVYILRVVTVGVPSKSTEEIDTNVKHIDRIPMLKMGRGIVILIAVAYTLKMIFEFLDQGSYFNLAISLFSVLIQFSTLFIMSKLKSKIELDEALLQSQYLI